MQKVEKKMRARTHTDFAQLNDYRRRMSSGENNQCVCGWRIMRVQKRSTYIQSIERKT